jgi:hypothetical protein
MHVVFHDAIEIPAEYLSKRLENLTALHLLKACQFWTDTAQGEYDLRFVKKRYWSLLMRRVFSALVNLGQSIVCQVWREPALDCIKAHALS